MSVFTTATLDAPIESVWAIISDFANLMRWHPMVSACETTGEGLGAIRRVAFDSWWAVETLTEIDHAQHDMAYFVSDSSRPEAIGATGRMTLTALSENSTKLEWFTRQAEGNPQEAELDAQLRNYYPLRVEHLRAAIGLPANG